MTVSGGAAPRDHGDPWASLVTYGLLDGAPVLCVSQLAEHGRNLAGVPAAKYYIDYHAAINSVDELAPATVELVRQATAVTRERGPKGGGP